MDYNFNDDSGGYRYTIPETKKPKKKTEIRHSKFTNPFHQWTIDNLPDSQSFWITDIDGVIRTRSGKIAIFEAKARKQQMGTVQSVTYQILDHALRTIHNTNVTVSIGYGTLDIQVDYVGFFKIIFENTCPSDGKCWVNGEEVTEERLIDILSFTGGE